MNERAVLIQMGNDKEGWCSSCDSICDTGIIDARGRYCCGVCGDYLIFAEEEELNDEG